MTTQRMELAFPTVARINKGLPKSPDQPGKDLKQQMRITFYPGAESYRELLIATHPELRGQNWDGKLLTVTRLHGMIPLEKVWDTIQIYHEAHQAGRMVFRADDDHVLIQRDPTTGAYLVKRGDPHTPFDPTVDRTITYTNKAGKEITLPIRMAIRFRVFLPELGRLVFFEVKSTSVYDAINLRQQLGAIQMLANMLNRGIAAGIPYYIFRREQTVTWNKKDGSAARVPHYLLNVEVDPEWVKAATRRMGAFALSGQQIAGFLQPVEEIAGEEDPEAGIDDPEEAPVEPEHEQMKAQAQEAEARPDDAPAAEATQREQHIAETIDAALQQPDSTPSEQAVNPDRPYPPARLVSRLGEMAGSIRAANPRGIKNQPNLREFLKGVIEQLLDGHAANYGQDIATARVELLKFLTGHADIKTVPMETVLAMKRWLQPQVIDGGQAYDIEPNAELEAINAYESTQEKTA